MNDLRAAKRVGYIAGYGLAVVSGLPTETGEATPYQDAGQTPWPNFCPRWIDDADVWTSGTPHMDAFKEAFFEGIKDARK